MIQAVKNVNPTKVAFLKWKQNRANGTNVCSNLYDILFKCKLHTCTPKNGSVAEPGFIGHAPGSGEIMVAPVSVCHQVSIIGQRLSPTTLKYQCHVFGLIVSPTVPKRRSEEREYCRTTCNSQTKWAKTVESFTSRWDAQKGFIAFEGRKQTQFDPKIFVCLEKTRFV